MTEQKTLRAKAEQALRGLLMRKGPVPSIMTTRGRAEIVTALMPVLTVGRSEAAELARSASLPAHYRWGADAMEQFDFGKECAAQAILEAPRAIPEGQELQALLDSYGYQRVFDAIAAAVRSGPAGGINVSVEAFIASLSGMPDRIKERGDVLA